MLAACVPGPAVVQPDGDACVPPEGWYRQSDSCVDVVRMPAGRWEELSRLRDSFVVYAEVCGSEVCGPVPAIPPVPGVTPQDGGYVEGDCGAWMEWDRAMVLVAGWAECTK